MSSGIVPATDFGRDSPRFEQLVLRLRLIGSMAAWTLEPASVLPPGRKTRALLAILAMAMPRPVTRARLAEMLWSGRPEEQSRASLRQELHRLQEALAATGAELLQVSRDNVGLKPEMVWVDTIELMEATVERPSALVLMDRELLEDMDGIDPMFDQWLAEQRERLRLRARSLAEGLLADVTDPDMAMASAQRLLSIDNAHEGAWRALIRGFALRGEHGMATQAFERCKASLAEHLGATPSPETLQLVAQIRTGRTADHRRHTPTVEHAAPARRTAATLAAPRIGVLPLRVAGDSGAFHPVSVGLADEITGALARSRWFTAVSSAAVQRVARTTDDEKALRSGLGLDYLLDGGLQAAGRSVRLTMRLIDLTTDLDVLWAERFDAEIDDILSMQDRMASLIAARVESALLSAEASRAPDPARATDHLRAVSLMLRFERSDFDRAGTILREALATHSDRASVYTWYTLWHVMAAVQGWDEEPSETPAKALALAVRAQALDPLDPRALAFHGMVRNMMFRQPHQALALFERARQLNPGFPSVWAVAGRAYAHIGDLDEAERHLAECDRLAPVHPMRFLFDTIRLLISLVRRDFAGTVAGGRALVELHPGYVAPYAAYLSALGHLGEITEATRVLGQVKRIKSDISIAGIAARMGSHVEEHRKIIIDGLRLAGVPEQAS